MRAMPGRGQRTGSGAVRGHGPPCRVRVDVRVRAFAYVCVHSRACVRAHVCVCARMRASVYELL
jgi:hypothetical protein